MPSPLSRHSITGEKIAELRKKHAKRYTESLGRIADARDLLIGKLRAPLPDVIASRPDGEAFRVDTAQKYTSVLQLVNKLSEPEPELKRPKLATSDEGERFASRVERFINPVVSKLLNNRDLTELMLVEAEGCALVIPEVARWQKAAGPYYESDGETIKPSFQRDQSGKTLDDYVEQYEGDQEKAKGEFKVDEKRSRAVYDTHVKERRARNFPIDVELVSRQQMIPINPRIKGEDVEVDGVIIRTRLAASEAMQRKYIVPGLTLSTEPKNEDEGDLETGDLWHDQAWLTDIDEKTGELCPYVAHSLMGRPTTIDRPGYKADAVIDLREQCGLTRLPVVYGYGWRWFSVDPDARAIPYTFPFGRSWLAADAFLTGKVYAGWSEGMLAWFMQMPDTITDTAMQQAWMEFVDTHPLTIEPFKIMPVWGRMLPAQHPGTGRDVNETIAALQGSNSQELVNPLARGGGDAASAIERTVVSADTIAGIMDIRRSVLNVRRKVGELILETCVGISKETKQDVLFIATSDTPSDTGSPTRAILELKPSWLGPDGEESFDLVAYYPKSLDDNLAAKAQAFGFYKEGAITFEDWCNEIGISDPERYRAQLIFDRWIMQTPEGMQVAMKDAAEYLGDQELKNLFDAQKSGAAGPQGQPMGMLAGLNPPMGGPPGAAPGGGLPPDAQAAVGMQNPAQSQMAAIVGAARNASVGGVQPVPQPNGAGGM